jgi:hypothetical protein
VQVIKAGKRLARILKVLPTGEKHNTTLINDLTLLMKNIQQFSLVSDKPAPFTCNGGLH